MDQNLLQPRRDTSVQPGAQRPMRPASQFGDYRGNMRPGGYGRPISNSIDGMGPRPISRPQPAAPQPQPTQPQPMQSRSLPPRPVGSVPNMDGFSRPVAQPATPTSYQQTTAQQPPPQPAQTHAGAGQSAMPLQNAPVLRPPSSAPGAVPASTDQSAAISATDTEPGNVDLHKTSNKQYKKAVLLSYFFGLLGVDRFYLGFTLKAIIKLVTLGGLTVWATADFIKISFGSLSDTQERTLHGYKAPKLLTKIGLIVAVIVQYVVYALIIVGVTHMASASAQAGTRDDLREQSLTVISGQLEQYYSSNGSYPSLAQVNDPLFNMNNMPGMMASLLKDPTGTQSIMVTEPMKGAYAYATTPANCDNKTVKCTSFILTASLEHGGKYTINSRQ